MLENNTWPSNITPSGSFSPTVRSNCSKFSFYLFPFLLFLFFIFELANLPYRAYVCVCGSEKKMKKEKAC